jgi:UTP--glucose-1-phosphate uridylyltransferase
MTDKSFLPFEAKMRKAGLPDIAVATFAHYYHLVEAGETGLLSESQIEPVETLPSVSDLPLNETASIDALSRTAIIKLNGGLGTSMGMTHAKSLLRVKDDLNFLDVTARQVMSLRARHDCRLPLVLMNSFRTRDDSLRHLEIYEELKVDGLGLEFSQNKVPRIRCDTLEPLEWSEQPEYEWCPPGHGDLYGAINTSGMLDDLLNAGFEYAFVSNGDNLGAVLSLEILGWFSTERLPFLMEVAHRTQSDRKGGHLARYRNRNDLLVLRESAQCPAQESDVFQDIERYRYFNTNNLWMNLRAVKAQLDKHLQVLPLPLILNKKRVVSTDATTPMIYQTETAMGAAISVFEAAAAIVVGRERFAPVKTTNDLLVMWSNRYTLTADYCLLPSQEDQAPLHVQLDPTYFGSVSDFEKRFAKGPPNLAEASRFEVQGDVWFGAGVIARGDVKICAKPGTREMIPDGTVLDC